MSKVQFWAIMYVLCNICSNGEKTEQMQGQWGYYEIFCIFAMVVSAFREEEK